MYNPIELSRIDRQIEDLQRLKASYQNMPQQPINNIINTPAPVSMQPIFEAKFTTENPADIFVANKTAFIDLKNGKLTIKEIDGEIKEYFLILPKDEKDLKIENLERKLREMEAKINTSYNQQPVQTPVQQKVDMPINNSIEEEPVNNYIDQNYTEMTNNMNTQRKEPKLRFKKN